MKRANFIGFLLNTTLFLASGGMGVAFAQDIHFSQFSMTPLMLNPALTGLYEGDQRVSLNYKNQWQGMGASGAAYNTSLFSFDTHLFKKKWRKGYLGAGLDAYKDVAGDLKMGTTQLNISIAGIVVLNSSQLLSGGMQVGYCQKNISTTAMQWENQYDSGTGTFNSSLPSNDIISAPPPLRYGDFSAGLAWNYATKQSSLSADDELKINLGLAAFNINPRKQDFSIYESTDQLYSKFVVHGSALIGIRNTNIALVPNAVFFKQGPSNELNIGTLVRWTISGESKYTGYTQMIALSLGAQYRTNDALIPMVLFEYSKYALGLSYDINTSSLMQGTHGRGGVEISLRYTSPNPFSRSSSRLFD